MPRLILLLLVGLIVHLGNAKPTNFLAGRFLGAHGTGEAFNRYGLNTEPEPGWQRLGRFNIGGDHGIRAFDSVGSTLGVFVAGSFTGNDLGISSNQVAFFDGEKWCPVSQGLFGTLQGVSCLDDENCYVVGEELSSVESDFGVNRIAHYQYIDGIWQLQQDLLWSLDETLDATFTQEFRAVAHQGSAYFFALTNNGLYRGGKVDGGWIRIDIALTSVTDFDVNVEADYMVAVDSANLVYSPAPFGALSRIDWAPLIKNLSSDFYGFVNVHAATPYKRYAAGILRGKQDHGYHFDRYYIFEQVDNGQPVPLGLAFVSNDVNAVYNERNATNPFMPYWGLQSLPDGSPLVFGNFEGVNFLEAPYPIDPHGDHNTIHARYSAAYDYVSSSWYQPFGGGLTSPPTHVTYAEVDGKQYYHTIGGTGAFDLLANQATWFDDASDLVGENKRPWFPLIHEALFARYVAPIEEGKRSLSDYGNYGIVNVITPRWWDDLVYVGGQFDYVGATRCGSILRTKPVRTAEDFEWEEVGGGLWLVEYETPNSYEDYLVAGTVNDVATQWHDVYAVGSFSRTISGKSLSNVARLRHGNDEWEDVGGGCGGNVYGLSWFDYTMVVVGEFHFCGGKYTNYVAAWSKNQWSSLNTGLDYSASTITRYRDEWVVGGSFSSAGGVFTGGLAAWNGERWRSLQNNCDEITCDTYDTKRFTVTQVHSLEAHGDALYALGAIVEFTIGDQGNQTARRRARRNSGSKRGDACSTVPLSICMQMGDTVLAEGQPALLSWDGNRITARSLEFMAVPAELSFEPEDGYPVYPSQRFTVLASNGTILLIGANPESDRYTQVYQFDPSKDNYIASVMNTDLDEPRFAL